MSVAPVAPAVTPAPVAPAATPPAAPAVTPPVAPQVEATPPWGTPEQFDPAKAWDLITKLREQKNDPAAAKELKDLREFKAKAEDANRTEVEREQARANAAEKTAAENAARVALLEAAVKHKLDEADLETLQGIPADRIDALAARLASGKPAAPVVPVAPGATGQGPVGAPIGGPSDPIAALDLQIAEATKAGNLQMAIALKEQRFALANTKH